MRAYHTFAAAAVLVLALAGPQSGVAQPGWDSAGNGFASLHGSLDPPVYLEEDILAAADAGTSDHFGYSVGADTGGVVIGSRYHDVPASVAGAAYVFVRSGDSWTQQQKLTPTDIAASDQFGLSVDIAGDYVVVGATGHDHLGNSAGAAYVFVRSGSSWSQQQELHGSDTEALDVFGRSVGIDGNSVIVGASGEDDGGASSGSAYVFVRSGTTWSQQGKLNASDDEALDLFGTSVAIEGDTALVGATSEFDADPLTGKGSAYVFTRSGTVWSQQEKPRGSDVAAGDVFGLSVALSGDHVVVGAPGQATDRGAVYVFVRSGSVWTEKARLRAPDGVANDQFGSSVAIIRDLLVVGADGKDAIGNTTNGQVYVFSGSGAAWALKAQVAASGRARQTSNGSLGAAVALVPGTPARIIAGAYTANHPTLSGWPQTGAVYVFRENFLEYFVGEDR